MHTFRTFLSLLALLAAPAHASPELDAAFAALAPALQACHTEGLSRVPDLAGAVGVELALDASGRVSSTSLTASELHDMDVELCVMGVLNKATLPGTSPVARTLHFAPDHLPTTSDPNAPRAMPVPSGATEAAVMAKGKAGAYKCYQTARKKLPSLRGALALELSIAEDGVVQKAEITSSSLKNVPLETCVQGAYQALVFPAEPGGIREIFLPMTFPG